MQGTRVITASSDKTSRIWDTQTGECLQVGWSGYIEGVVLQMVGFMGVKSGCRWGESAFRCVGNTSR